jgi:D-sedoheptulose 7-phosphate isomerase
LSAEEKIQQSISVLTEWMSDPIQRAVFYELTENALKTFQNGGKIIFVGNGGSAAEASHLAGEFIGKCSLPSRPLPAISLSDSSVLMTALSNDYGIEHMFTRGLEALANSSDLVIFLSTSGSSPNIVASLKFAQDKKFKTSLWTSKKFSGSAGISNFTIIAPTFSTPRAQELHLVLGHTLAEIVEMSHLD